MILFFSVYGVSLYTLAVAGDGVGQMTFSVSFALFGIVYGALLGLFSVSIGGHSALTNKGPVTVWLAYDRGMYTIYLDRTASLKFPGFNGMKGLKSEVQRKSHTTRQAPNEQTYNSRWAHDMHPV